MRFRTRVIVPPSLFPSFVFSEELAAVRAVVLGDVQAGDAEGNEAAGPTPDNNKLKDELAEVSV